MADNTLGHTAGVLLAGGRSSRFGSEKALARFRGEFMLDVVARRFSGLAAFAVSTREDSAAARRACALGIPVLPDAPSHASGPLRGVCAGLRWAGAIGCEFLATAPCDAPLLPSDLFERLLCSMGEAPAAYAVTALGTHPLCAVWRVRLLAPLSMSLAEGEHPSVRQLLADIGASAIVFADEGAFLNANTPAALAEMERAA